MTRMPTRQLQPFSWGPLLTRALTPRCQRTVRWRNQRVGAAAGACKRLMQRLVPCLSATLNRRLDWTQQIIAIRPPRKRAVTRRWTRCFNNSSLPRATRHLRPLPRLLHHCSASQRRCTHNQLPAKELQGDHSQPLVPRSKL